MIRSAERHALILILLGDGHDEPKIAAHQLVERLFLTHADALRQIDLFLLRNQRVLADLAQVLVQRALVERRTALTGTDLHWTHAARPRTDLGSHSNIAGIERTSIG